jgi:hypothetical protein
MNHIFSTKYQIYLIKIFIYVKYMAIMFKLTGLAKFSFIVSFFMFILGTFFVLTSINTSSLEYYMKQGLAFCSWVICGIFFIGFISVQQGLPGKVKSVKLSQIYKKDCADKKVANADLIFLIAELKCSVCEYADKEDLSQVKPYCQSPEPPDIKGLHCDTLKLSNA